MNYLSGALRYVAGGDSAPSVSIPRLVDRLTSASLPQDRRSALSALVQVANTSPSRQAHVAELAVKPLYAVLEQDADYDDTIKAALDLLLALCGTLDPPTDPKALHVAMADQLQGGSLPSDELLKAFEDATAHVAQTNVDIFLGLPAAVSLLLSLFDKQDFYLRFTTIELLTAMAANSCPTLQGALLEAPQGVSRICDLLDDSHRLLRSNAVLLLSTLCSGSSEISKIVAYAGVLEKLFVLIESPTRNPLEPYPTDEDDEDEDTLEAAIVVQDVLYVLRNLIRGAATTRTIFRDSGSLPRLVNLIKRSAVDANLSAAQQITTPESGRKGAVERQARKNLVLAMQCIEGLVQNADNDSRLVKNDLATTNLFNILAGMAFAPAAKSPASEQDIAQPEHVLNIRVGSLKTLALLARGHDDFRSMFSSVTFSITAEGDVTCAQKAALAAMFGDSSSAVRLASYVALRESFVVDAGLDLPSSNLLNAMTSAGVSTGYAVRNPSASLTRNSLSSNDLASPKSPLPFIAESLKVALVDWPSITDAAGVFYAAALVMWMLSRIDGARERLLTAYVHGNSLLSQVVRSLGKLEREKGSPETRIALFSLACTWLHGSSSAVSAFLSSAMHLPMLVDILNGSGTRGDVAEVHSRGLSAVLLGICLQATDGSRDVSNDSGFISGSEEASMAIPRGTLADVIRNRIGVTVFTASLDDLRASKAYMAEETRESIWSFAEELTVTENRKGFLSRTGNLGHDRWYNPDITHVVTDVYKNVGARALDLISDQTVLQNGLGLSGRSALHTNGHVGDGHDEIDSQKAILADSTRDEVLNSYKEFIRSQDESLNASRRQIEELATALRETQQELDATAATSLGDKEIDKNDALQAAMDELRAQKEAMESLIEEKNRDFAALSEAYAALEEDHNSQGANNSVDAGVSKAAEVASLRAQNSALQASLNDEITKNMEMNQHATRLDNALRVKDSEVAAVLQERDMLQRNVQPDLPEALQWRTRAEIAETTLLSYQSNLEALEQTKRFLESQLETARREENAMLSQSSPQRELDATRAELDELRSTRRRELQVARESSQVANATAQQQISTLKEKLAEVHRAQSHSRAAVNMDVGGAERQEHERLVVEHRSLASKLDEMKTALSDTQSAVAQWQKRTEAEERAKMQEMAEKERLANVLQELEGEVQTLKSSAKSDSELLSARVVELQQQNDELNEMRRRANEEAKVLKEDLAARTEQTIRLSGQLYETEEAKEKFEETVVELQQQLSDAKRSPAQGDRDVNEVVPANADVESESENLKSQVSALQEELAIAKDALADSDDLKNLVEANAREREAAVGKVLMLEDKLTTAQKNEAKLTTDLDLLKERLLSLDEAEDAKRSLTMQVVSLQESLAKLSPGTSSEANAKLQESDEALRRLKNEIQEKDLRLQGLESSLTVALDRADVSERKSADAEKQVAESETMFSVLSSERDSLSTECDRLRGELDLKMPTGHTYDSSVPELEQKLEESEKKAAATSNELASLVDACRRSEKEVQKMREEHESLRLVVTSVESELEFLQREKDSIMLEAEVRTVVNASIHDSVMDALSKASSELVDTVRYERDAAVAMQSAQTEKLELATAELDSLHATIERQDVALAANAKDIDQLTQLTATVTRLEEIERERNEVVRSLQDSEALVSSLKQENDQERQRLEETSRWNIHDEITATEREACRACIDVAKEPATARVIDLEGALRDAARTVSATNLELIAAQALLVELSADKTAIRTELNCAQEEIEGLKARLSFESHDPKHRSSMSEVSEPERGSIEELVDGCQSCNDRGITEESFRVAQAEVENLRTIVQRSASEADSAASLLGAIELKIEQIEGEFQSAKLSLDDAKLIERRLHSELADVKKSHEICLSNLKEEKENISQELTVLRVEKDKASTALSTQLKNLESTLSVKREEFQCQLDVKDEMIEKLKCRDESLSSQLQEVTEELAKLSERADTLEEGNYKYRKAIEDLEDRLSNTKEELSKSNDRKESLAISLQQSKDAAEQQKDAFDEEVRRLKSDHAKESQELEAEVDRSNQALENAERRFRISTKSLKSTIAGLESALETKENSIVVLKRESLSTSEKLATSSQEVKKLKSLQEEVAEETRKVVSALTTERDVALGNVQEARDQLETKTRMLAGARSSIARLECDLKEAQARNSMLLSENEDYVTSIESLETNCKRLVGNLSQTDVKLRDVTLQFENCTTLLDEKKADLEESNTQLKDSRSKCQKLEGQRAKLEEQVDGLQEEVDSCVRAREEVERDNKDLKAWVADLERQATDLHRAAEDFSEVEESLRQTMESLRQVAEQNGSLTEEVKKEREAIAKLEAQLRGAVREKSAAEAGRDASQKRTSDLEERIRRVREEHIEKLSESEAGMRSKVERCAELETKVAVAERKLAELASVSDTLFGAQAELVEREEDVRSLRERAVVAEQRAEDLESTVQRLESEAEEVRESESGEAYRAMEAEHNELLVCLAEMELECTTLKEELGRE